MHFQIPSATHRSCTWTQQVQTCAHVACMLLPLHSSKVARGPQNQTVRPVEQTYQRFCRCCCISEGSRVDNTFRTALSIRHAPPSSLLHFQIPSATHRSCTWTQQVQTCAHVACMLLPLHSSKVARGPQNQTVRPVEQTYQRFCRCCCISEGSRVDNTFRTALSIRHAPPSSLLHFQIPSATHRSCTWTQQVQTCAHVACMLLPLYSSKVARGPQNQTVQ